MDFEAALTARQMRLQIKKVITGQPSNALPITAAVATAWSSLLSVKMEAAQMTTGLDKVGILCRLHDGFSLLQAALNPAIPVDQLLPRSMQERQALSLRGLAEYHEVGLLQQIIWQ